MGIGPHLADDVPITGRVVMDPAIYTFELHLRPPQGSHPLGENPLCRGLPRGYPNKVKVPGLRCRSGHDELTIYG